MLEVNETRIINFKWQTGKCCPEEEDDSVECTILIKISQFPLQLIGRLPITKTATSCTRKVIAQIPMNVQVFDSVLREDYLLPNEYPSSLIGAIDQGTSSTRFLVFTQKGRIAASAQVEHRQIYKAHAAGWHEHDPLEIFRNTQACIQVVGDKLKAHGIDIQVMRLDGLGITNQRETTIAWNRVTGIPYYKAVVWDDTRTQIVAEEASEGDPNRLRNQTGLPIAAYFAGTKVKWLLDNVPALRRDVEDPIKQKDVCFGTVDTWLIYQLTGRPSTDQCNAANQGGYFYTDVTNASRWLFMNLESVAWDQSLMDDLCAPHHLPVSCLPEILPSCHIFGRCTSDNGVPYLTNVPIAGVLGDQQAALFGQTAFSPGEAKNTYGTGLFLMMNTGTTATRSEGLLTTVAYQLGKDEPVHYALEGSVSHSGSTIQWLRDQLQIIPSAPESEALATLNNDGLYFVPAFAGLFAPHWRSDARACLVGLTTSHHKGHICRAALEATAYQTREVFDAIRSDAVVELQSLNVDGGGTGNNLLMQFQADILQVPVVKPVIQETKSLGAAFCAGLAVGVWKDLDEIKKLWAVSRTYHPQMSLEERNHNWNGWNKAVSKSLGWVDVVAEEPVEAIGTRVPVSNSDGSYDEEEDGPKTIGTSFEDLAPIVEGQPLTTTGLHSVVSSCTALVCSAAIGMMLGVLIGAGGALRRQAL